MKQIIAALIFIIGTALPAFGQAPVCPSPDLSCPASNFNYGNIPTPAQWVNWWNSRQNALNFTPLNPANNLSEVANKATARTNLQIPNTGLITYTLSAISFNAANTDHAVTIALPTGFTRFTIEAVVLSHPSVTMSTATFGVFTATAGGGTQLVPTTTVAITSASENTTGNAQRAAGTTTVSSNAATVQLRTITAQGSAATADVALVVRPLL